MAKKEGSGHDHATEVEIEAAIRALSPADLLRLRAVAAFRARSYSKLHLGQGAEDLLQEAMARTLENKRKWRRDVPFLVHLIRSMESIASHIPDELKGNKPSPAELESLPLEGDSPSAEREVAARERLDQIFKHFEGDEEVGLVIEGMASGMTGPDIQSELGISQREYEAIVLRLRRGITRSEGWRP